MAPKKGHIVANDDGEDLVHGSRLLATRDTVIIGSGGRITTTGFLPPSFQVYQRAVVVDCKSIVVLDDVFIEYTSFYIGQKTKLNVYFNLWDHLEKWLWEQHKERIQAIMEEMWNRPIRYSLFEEGCSYSL